MDSIRFTIFTPTFNRRELIGRTFESLRSQTLPDFEWLIIDDGSTDGTSEVVREFKRNARFPVRYLHQPNRGKHCAHNRAAAEANGELFAVLDSDDALVPRALERLFSHWVSIPDDQRSRYSGVTCLCMDQEGHVVGRRFPLDVLDCRHYELEGRFRATGEKWGFHRTAILRRFPYPEIPGERYCPEAIVWNRIAREYLVRHVNEPLRVFFQHEAGITGNVRTLLMRSPRGSRLFYQEYLALDLPVWCKYKHAINYVRYSLHAGARALEAIADSGLPGLTAALAVPGCALYARDLLRHAPARQPVPAGGDA